MAMTYDSLVQNLKDYLQREDTETINNIPNFIFFAQQKACSDIKNIGLELYVNGTFVPGVDGGAVIPKPGGWRRTISFNYGSGALNSTRTFLKLASYEWLNDYWPNRSLTSPPEYYSDYGFDHWLIAPTPDFAYPFEIAYIGLPEPINAQAQTNWFTNYAPHVLLYGSLIQAQPFVRNLEMFPAWDKLYRESVDAINKQDEDRIYDRSSRRNSD